MAFEEAVYEVVFFSQPDDGKILTFKLAPIQPRTLIRRQGKLGQYIPAQVAQMYKIQQFIPLTPEHIFTFKAPAYMRSKLSSIMEDLAYLSDHLLSPVLSQTANTGSKLVPFDYNAFSYTQKRAIADAVKYIGWNARDLFQEQTLEFYELHQAFLFEKFILELRHSILDILNQAIHYAGQEIGFSGQIQIEGLPTLAEIEDAQRHLFAGDQTFKSLKLFMLY